MAGVQAEARREGGRRRSRPRNVLPADAPEARFRSVKDVCCLLSDTINDVRKGRLDPRIANTVGYLAGTLIRAFEVGELEDRLAAVEAAVKASEPSMENPFSRPLPGDPS